MSRGAASHGTGGDGESSRGDGGEPPRSVLATYLKYSHVGVQFFLAVALCTGGGIWLDKRCGTVVLFTLVGLVLGFSGGLLSIYRELGPKDRSPTGRSEPPASGPKKPGPKP